MGSNALLWNRLGFYGNFSKLYEKKKGDKSTNPKLMDKTYCREISVELTIILKQTQGPKSKLSFTTFFLFNQRTACIIMYRVIR